jgi:hypothetical protein
MKSHPKIIIPILCASLLIAGIALFALAFRYKIVEIGAGDEKIKVKIDRWTGKRYRTLYRVDVAEAASILPIKEALPGGAAPARPTGPSPLPSRIAESPPAERDARSLSGSRPERPQSLTTPRELEVASAAPPSSRDAAEEGKQPDCGFPITTSELINMALRNWCTARQGADYLQMSGRERANLRYRVWEKACKKSVYRAYWKALPFQQRKKISQIYYEIAAL